MRWRENGGPRGLQRWRVKSLNSSWRTLFLLSFSLLLLTSSFPCASSTIVNLGYSNLDSPVRDFVIAPTGSCKTWDGIPSFCQAETGYHAGMQFFVPATGIATTGTELIQALTNSYSTFLALHQLPRVCRVQLKKILCGSFLRPCLTINNISYPIPVQPCKALCLSEIDLCASFFGSMNIPNGYGLYFPGNFSYPITCNETDPSINDQPFFPESAYTVQLSNNQSLTLNCTAMPGGSIKLSCNAPLQQTPEKNGCGYGCPLPAISDSEMDIVLLLQKFLGWLSWITSLFMVVSSILNPRLRRFPANLVHIAAASSVHIVSWAVIMPSILGDQEVWCNDTGQITPEVYFGGELTMSFSSLLVFQNSLCTIQGALLYYGLVSSTLWWFIIGLNSFIQVYFIETRKLLMLTQHRWRIAMRVVYSVIAWGVPLLLIGIAILNGCLGLGYAQTFCFVVQTCEYWAWLVPIPLVLFFGTLLYVLTFIQTIVLHKRQTRKAFNIYLQFYVRIIIFSIIFWILYLMILSYKLELALSKSSTVADLANYYFCLLISESNNKCELSLDTSNSILLVAHSFAISGLGLFLFLNFVSFEMFLQWARIANACWGATDSNTSFRPMIHSSNQHPGRVKGDVRRVINMLSSALSEITDDEKGKGDNAGTDELRDEGRRRRRRRKSTRTGRRRAKPLEGVEEASEGVSASAADNNSNNNATTVSPDRSRNINSRGSEFSSASSSSSGLSTGETPGASDSEEEYLDDSSASDTDTEKDPLFVTGDDNIRLYYEK